MIKMIKKMMVGRRFKNIVVRYLNVKINNIHYKISIFYDTIYKIFQNMENQLNVPEPMKYS